MNEFDKSNNSDFRAAVRARKQFKTGAAKAILLKLTQQFPRAAAVFTELAKVYVHEHNFQQAEACCQHILKDDPDEHRTRCYLGVIHREQGHYKAAKDAFQTVLHRDPKNTQALIEMGMTYHLQDYHDRSLDYFLKAAGQRPRGLIGLEKISQLNSIVSADAISAGLAHEVKNPLAAINLALSNLYRSLDSGKLPQDKLREKLAEICSQSKRIDELINHFDKLVKRKPQKAEPFSIVEVIEQAYTLFKEQLNKRGITMDLDELRYADRGMMIQGYRIELEQVFINLIGNARDALEKRTDAYIKIWLNKRVHEVEIFVEDNGPGIPAGKQREIFNFLFTTKDTGTGLGLWLCERVVEKHRGTIEHDVEFQNGTRFYIKLPILRSAS